MSTLSLRARLTAIILVPLLLIAALIGWRAVLDAQDRANARFNRALLSAALAISRDVAVSGGDALSPDTNALLRDTSGGQVFYHVYAPDGVFVTGYATPPVPVTETFVDQEGQQYFEGLHQSRPVRALRFVDAMQVDGLSGDFTVTVWQDRDLHRDLVRDLSSRTLQVIGWLVLTVALVVWFGVRFGLRPLLDLESAIARRSSSDLAPIRRAVPAEVGGIVGTLNRLFAQVSHAMTAQSEFIGNAAHQLRNPIAGVLSLAEALDASPDGPKARDRARDLLEAAQETADLSQKLLMLERADALTPQSAFARINLGRELAVWVEGYQKQLPPHVALHADIAAEPLWIEGDAVMLREAFSNLVDNAVRHGGSDVSRIDVAAARETGMVCLEVRDNGAGIPQDRLEDAAKRFVQLAEGRSGGLGLSIVEAIARGHGGTLELSSETRGLRARLLLPTIAPS